MRLGQEQQTLILRRALEISQERQITDAAWYTCVLDNNISFILQVYFVAGYCRMNFHMEVFKVAPSSFNLSHNRCSHVETYMVTDVV